MATMLDTRERIPDTVVREAEEKLQDLARTLNSVLTAQVSALTTLGADVQVRLPRRDRRALWCYLLIALVPKKLTWDIDLVQKKVLFELRKYCPSYSLDSIERQLPLVQGEPIWFLQWLLQNDTTELWINTEEFFGDLGAIQLEDITDPKTGKIIKHRLRFVSKPTRRKVIPKVRRRGHRDHGTLSTGNSEQEFQGSLEQQAELDKEERSYRYKAAIDEFTRILLGEAEAQAPVPSKAGQPHPSEPETIEPHSGVETNLFD